MEEELCNMHSEENKDFPEKNKKRKLKTPSQVIALEKFYNDHKYPTEEMKSQLAEQLGLTEKQISGWFCHRRLKDKRFCETYANVRQDRSSIVIQDHGSGLAQDSCGSTKNGDHWHIDPREVESQKPYSHEFPAIDNVLEHRIQYTENISNMDNTSSESSSSLKDRLLSQSENPYDMEVSRYLTHDGAIPPSNPKVLNSLRYKPSGYLKVKGEIENAAITAVKRQLGMQYREDGPPLGVEFQPLPPGAFESPMKDPIHDSYYAGNSTHSRSPDTLAVKKQRALGSRYEMHSSNMTSRDSFMEETIPTSSCIPESQDRNTLYQLKKSSNYYNKSDPFPGQSSPLNMYEESGGETFFYSSKMDHRMSSSYNVPRCRTDSISNHRGPYTAKVASEQTETQLHNFDSAGSKSFQRSGYSDYKQLNSKKMSKEMFNGEEKAAHECSDPVRVRVPPTKQLAVVRRCQLDFPRPDCAVKASFPEKSGRKNHVRRSTMEMPCSFTVDEAADTSSSLD